MDEKPHSTRRGKKVVFRLGQQTLPRNYSLPIYLVWTLYDARKALGKSFNVMVTEALTTYFQAHKLKIVSLDEVDMGRQVPLKHRPEAIAHLYPPGESIPEQPLGDKEEWRYRN